MTEEVSLPKPALEIPKPDLEFTGTTLTDIRIPFMRWVAIFWMMFLAQIFGLIIPLYLLYLIFLYPIMRAFRIL